MRFIRRLAVRSMGSMEGFVMEFNRGNSKEKQGDLNCYRLQDKKRLFDVKLFYGGTPRGLLMGTVGQSSGTHRVR